MTRIAKNKVGDVSLIIQMKPVGIIRNQNQQSTWNDGTHFLIWQERVAKMKEQQHVISELIIDPSLDGILDGIDEFSHLMVLYWAHLVPPDKRTLTRVHPLGRDDFPLVGIFATHSPARPNTILTTVVQLIERQGNVLKVTGLDALDGSPILDIKPYNGDLAKLSNISIPDWMRRIHCEFSEELLEPACK